MVVWLIGLSGAGKTTIGRAFYNKWKALDTSTVFVDGDEIRNIFKQDKKPSHYSLEGRRLNAERIFNICKWLDSQNINVVCCVLSLFPDLQAQNRKVFKRYFEVYVKVPIDILIERDNKGIYKNSKKNKTKNIVGVDIEFPDPPCPDLVIDNKEFDTLPEIWAKQIVKSSGILNLLPENEYAYANGDLMGTPNHYNYTKFCGLNFFEKWQNIRRRALEVLPNPVNEPPSFNYEARGTAGLLENTFRQALSVTNQKAPLPFYIELFLKKFEVSNRIYDDYNENFKPVDRTKFRTHANYVRAAESFEIVFRKTGDLRILNVMLKCMDTLTAHVKELNLTLGSRFARLIIAEFNYVHQIARKRKIKIE